MQFGRDARGGRLDPSAEPAEPAINSPQADSASERAVACRKHADAPDSASHVKPEIAELAADPAQAACCRASI